MSKKTQWRYGLLTLGLVFIVAVALTLRFASHRYVSTEDAYVKLDTVQLASQINGVLDSVAVKRNQSVKQGQVLATLDKTPYQIALQRANARLVQVANALKAKQAQFAQVQAQLNQAERDVAYAKRELVRNQQLKQLSASEALLDKLQQDYEQAQARQADLSAQLQSLKAQLNGGPEQAIAQHPDYLAAQADVEQAQYDLCHCQIIAPFAGQLGGSVPLKGQVVQQGQQVLTLTRANSAWIQANIKETAMTNVKSGDKATIQVDTYPDITWQASVSNISPAAGSEFALIPPQNGSGNWIKVVQRIPVVLHLAAGQDDKPELRAGMSVTVTIDTQTQAAP